MEDFSADTWQHKGSSVVFDRWAIGRLLESARHVSLRTALSWLHGAPSPPAPRSSILVSGLETLIQLLPPQNAHDFLLHRIRPLIIRLQNSWECGLIFGFAAPSQAFVEDPLSDEVLYQIRAQHQVRLSEGLWDGNAAVTMKRIVREASSQSREETLGYYVPRLS